MQVQSHRPARRLWWSDTMQGQEEASMEHRRLLGGAAPYYQLSYTFSTIYQPHNCSNTFHCIRFDLGRQ